MKICLQHFQSIGNPWLDCLVQQPHSQFFPSLSDWSSKAACSRRPGSFPPSLPAQKDLHQVAETKLGSLGFTLCFYRPLRDFPSPPCAEGNSCSELPKHLQSQRFNLPFCRCLEEFPSSWQWAPFPLQSGRRERAAFPASFPTDFHRNTENLAAGSKCEQVAKNRIKDSVVLLPSFIWYVLK